MNIESDFIKTFPLWKGGTKAGRVPVDWPIISGHLEETFYGQNIAECHLLLFLGNIFIL
jgi:hypothetical protein